MTLKIKFAIFAVTSSIDRMTKKESYFVDLIEISPITNVLDLASGSGDIIKLLNKKTSANFFSLDANFKYVENLFIRALTSFLICFLNLKVDLMFAK